MISLAGRDILHAWSKYVFTGVGLGLLIGVTLSMAGIYRGMVDDARALLAGSGADIWVVQQDTLGPFAEPSSLNDDRYRSLLALPGVAAAANASYLTMQARKSGQDTRVMAVGYLPGQPGEPEYLIAGSRPVRSHYQAIADVKTGFKVGDVVSLRRHQYEITGLTRRMVSASGDPMLFIPLKDAQEEQFLKDNDSIVSDRERIAANPAFARSGVLGAVQALQTSASKVNAVLVRVAPGFNANQVATDIHRWKRLTAYTQQDMEEVLTAKLIATSAKQIGLFLVILAVVTAAIVAFIIYTLTLGKIREIAVLKLIGAKNRTIAGMILQQALGLGLIGFIIGKTAATLWAPHFPKYVLLEPGDAMRGFFAVMLVCAIASTMAIRAALKVDPAEAIGG